MLTVIKNAQQTEMEAAQPAKLPVGDVIALQAVALHQESQAEQASIGVWESSPGKFKRHVPNREFCHILSGRCTFTPEGGKAVELVAGDAALFPANCVGEWDVQEKLRKTYVLF